MKKTDAKLRCAGFTLMESVIVLLLLGILSAVALMNNASPGVYTLQSQAERLAADVRHVQSLASTWGKSLSITVLAGTNGTYSVVCTNGGSAPCNGVNPVIDPTTNAAYVVSLQSNVALASTSAVSFDSFGRPSGPGSYTLSAGGGRFTVNVADLTGYVTVSTP